MFFGSRFSSYGRYGHDSSDDEEKVSPQFELARGNESAAAAGPTHNAALEAALSTDTPAAGPVIALENEDAEEGGMDIDAAVAAAQASMCVECVDQPATRTCRQCADNFCDVCFAAMHKRGTRARHTYEPYTAGEQLNAAVTKPTASPAPAASAASSDPMDESGAVASLSPAAAAAASSNMNGDISDDEFERVYQRNQQAPATAAAAAASPSSDLTDSDDDDDNASHASAASAPGKIVLPTMNSSLVSGNLSGRLPVDWFYERAKFIPLRLTLEERKYLRLLEATLNVSEYTDKIDIISSKDKMKRIQEQLKDLCSILSGLVVASDYKLGQKLIKDKDFDQNADWFRTIFELGRRHKIRNPEKMRSSYGKLVYIIQDSVNPQIEELMGFHLHAPLKTAFTQLEAAGAADCLRDERMLLATGDIKTEGRDRPEIERDIKRKEAAVKYLAQRYANDRIDEEGVRACILSVADNMTFLLQNRHCCDTMLQWLVESYHPTTPDSPTLSLAILGGRAGARLTHSHANQYSYVLQSLTLWREILHDFFRLWCLSEADLMDPTNPYRLRNTGQGLNRVQQAPRVGRAMHNILHHCQQKLGSWVGSSVIHLGDHNVPSSFHFIDKYTQVSRILNPIVLTIKALPRLCAKPDVKFYIDSIFGGAQKLKLLILTDFFRHAFDGSGADNFFDAGSCIDGRLTSAWNWCSKIEKKSYYPIFQLAGFSSFDGQWSE